jgi:alginate O-acetyltransferase complex protein AlgI
MVFSSAVFLFFFLPICLSAYYFSRRNNLVLLGFSLVFYAWGEPVLVTVMVGTIIVNFFMGRLIDVNRHVESRRKFLLAGGVALNVALLAAFKYANFFIAPVNQLLGGLGWLKIAAVDIPLPLGVSFFTFQSISYLIDIYRNETASEQRLTRFALFKTLFPQLIAGPIVRYGELAKQLENRKIDIGLFATGIERFVIGLAQKVLIADVLAVSVDKIFGLPGAELSFVVSWAGVLLFALQIYFDFSGYSNMAIGLSLMLGFRIPENFNFPYAALSIQDFWRRWHMTLSRWFRDYLYIPLGGSRHSSIRTGMNLFLVFSLCGLWHGANWTFVVWGLYHGLFLTLERTRFGLVLERMPVPIRHCYVLLVVAVGWLVFRASSLPAAAEMGRAMLGLNGLSNPQFALRQFADGLTLLSAIAGALFSFPWLGRTLMSWLQSDRTQGLLGAGKALCLSALFVVSIAFIGAQTHRAFIYFRF